MDEYRVQQAARIMMAAEEAGIVVVFHETSGQLLITGSVMTVNTFESTMAKYHREILHLIKSGEAQAQEAISLAQATARVMTKPRGEW